MVTGNSHIVTINPNISLGVIVTITHTGCKPVQNHGTPGISLSAALAYMPMRNNSGTVMLLRVKLLLSEP